MRDPFQSGTSKQFWRRVRHRLLAADSWLDSFFYTLMDNMRRGLAAYSARLERFNMRGWKRAVFELGSDGFTFGTAGAVLMLALAVPAFDETSQDWLDTQQYSVTFLDRYGNEIGKRGILHNDSVPLEEIPDHMIKATLATEDRRFYEHFGIDVFGTLRALMENVRAKTVVQGGSSLTQQLAKNLFLTNERTIERKIKEAFLALWLEANLSKNEILKLYLDRAYLGGGTFGVDAAAEFYFGKSVRDVSLQEAAMIAGLFKAPGRYAPHIDLPAARARANTVLRNMVEAGFLTEGQIYAARRNPATPVDRSNASTPDYFLDWAFEEVKRIMGGRGFVVTAKTTLDMGLQEAGETSVESHLRQYGREMGVSQAGMVATETDGAVRAMIGGRDYGESQFNRATNALRQPGSSFKPYVYITAFMNGYSPDSVVPDAPINIGGWSPQNYNRSYRGSVTLMTAMTHSLNTVPVRLVQAVSREKVIETVADMGVKTPIRMSRPLALGVSEMTVLDQVGGYASFASGGLRTVPYGISEIRDLSGKVLYRHATDGPKRERVFPPQTVADMNRMLHNVTVAGTGRRAQVPGVPTAGKTGTSQAYRDAWFIGYTGNYVAAVWMGNDNFSPTRRLTGGRLPAMTWQQFMAYAHTGVDVKPIPGVDGAAVQPAPEVAEVDAEGQDASRPLTLSRRSTELLFQIERLLQDAPPVEVPEPPVGPVSQIMFRGQPLEEPEEDARAQRPIRRGAVDDLTPGAEEPTSLSSAPPVSIAR